MIGLLTSGAKLLYPNSGLLNEVKTRYYIDESEVPRSEVILWEIFNGPSGIMAKTFCGLDVKSLWVVAKVLVD